MDPLEGSPLFYLLVIAYVYANKASISSLDIT